MNDDTLYHALVSSAGVSRYQGHCYKLSTSDVFKEWGDAFSDCVALGMKLVTFESEEEMDFVVNAVDASGSK